MPKAAGKDENLNELPTLVDAIRIGGTRERDLAARLLKQRLGRSALGDGPGRS
jgi:hypothetical protein